MSADTYRVRVRGGHGCVSSPGYRVRVRVRERHGCVCADTVWDRDRALVTLWSVYADGVFVTLIKRSGRWRAED